MGVYAALALARSVVSRSLVRLLDAAAGRVSDGLVEGRSCLQRSLAKVAQIITSKENTGAATEYLVKPGTKL